MKTIALPPWTVPTPGSVIADKFLVEAEIGRDGLAAMLSARQIEFDRLVLVRVLLPQWADDPRAVDQFRREGRASARGHREGVPRAFDGGTLGNGMPYVVLDDPVEGEAAALDAWPIDSSASARWRNRSGSDRVIAGGVFMLGAIGTAAFMWLYSTVHANDPRDPNEFGVMAMQPVANMLDAGLRDAASAPEGGSLTTLPATFDAGRASAGKAGADFLGVLRADAGPTVRELRRHLQRHIPVRVEPTGSLATRPVPAPMVDRGDDTDDGDNAQPDAGGPPQGTLVEDPPHDRRE